MLATYQGEFQGPFQLLWGSKNEVNNNKNPNKHSFTLLIAIAFKYHHYECCFSHIHLIPNPVSATSRAILKPVYWFEIPNSDPQTLKSVDFWCKLLPPLLSLFRMKNSQNFLGLCPLTPLGRAYSAPQTTQLYNCFLTSVARRKTDTPKKLLDMALTVHHC